MDAESEYPESPESFFFGDGIDWTSPIAETRLHVELPFWLMTPPGPVTVNYQATNFVVDICSSWMEVFGWEITDSRVTAVHQGPITADGWQPSPTLLEALAEDDAPCMMRPHPNGLRPFIPEITAHTIAGDDAANCYRPGVYQATPPANPYIYVVARCSESRCGGVDVDAQHASTASRESPRHRVMLLGGPLLPLLNL